MLSVCNLVVSVSDLIFGLKKKDLVFFWVVKVYLFYFNKS